MLKNNVWVWVSVGKADRPILCPDLVRQRCKVEWLTDLDMNDFPAMEDRLTLFLKELTDALGMKIFIGPVIGNDLNPVTKESGPSGLVGWTTSDATVHCWPYRKFASLDVYSCKEYVVETILEVVTKYFDPFKGYVEEG